MFIYRFWLPIVGVGGSGGVDVDDGGGGGVFSTMMVAKIH